LHDYWNNPNLSENERFLRDYILNKRYIVKDDDDDEESESNEEKDNEKVELNDKYNDKSEKKTKYNNSQSAKNSSLKQQPLDYVDLSEEEKLIEKEEEFERKYNFRFEEPNPEFIKSYPRTIADSARRKDTKRKEKRKEYKERKELEKKRKKEELKRLKMLKRNELAEKLEKLKKITGNYDLEFDLNEFDKDFDPDEYEHKMQVE
jgi:protein KRI1